MLRLRLGERAAVCGGSRKGPWGGVSQYWGEPGGSEENILKRHWSKTGNLNTSNQKKKGRKGTFLRKKEGGREIPRLGGGKGKGVGKRGKLKTSAMVVLP